MKDIRIKRTLVAAAAIAMTALLVYSCWEIKSISLPSTISANSEFEATIYSYVTPKESDYTTKLVAVFCVPKSWNAQQTATLTYSTSGYATSQAQKGLTVEEIVDEPMVPCPDDVLEMTTNLPFPQAFESKYFDGGNYGDVEWVAFIAENNHTFTDISGCSIKGFDINVKVKFKTDDVNYKFFMNVWLGGALRGMGTHSAGGQVQCTPVESTIVEVTGGSKKENYTVPAMVSTVPTEFRYGDFFCVNFQSNLEGAESELDGKDEVYLCGKAIYEDGSEVVVDKPLEKNLMTKKGHQYSKYIMPCLFFGTDYSKKIDKMYVWFTDKTGETVERCTGEIGWEFTQASNQ